ncbi:MAG: Holliday junction branch migration protein RuvA, partial [Halieaceae bacterium]|nr:Holliday junction branch migration protein RuvA [Halieaceae bacterium]
MIERLRGTILAKQAPEVVVDVGGIGYEVRVPMTTIYQLPAIGETTILLTHFVVREDAQQLYGFVREIDRRLFRDLIKVNGVGPKLALAILSGMDTEQFADCLNRNDVQALVALPGVGKKTGERLLVEMRDKAGQWLSDVLPVERAHSSQTPSVDVRGEAEQALVALGYKPTEASRLIAAVD